MDASALPYLYSFLADCLLILVGSFVQWRQRRPVLGFMLGWLLVDGLRCLLIILSAGDHGTVERNQVVWLIRGGVILQTSILIGAVFPFLKENVKFK